MSAEDATAAAGGFTVQMSFAASNVAEQWRIFKRQLTYYFDSKFTSGQLTEKRRIGVLMTALGRDGVEILDSFFDLPDEPKYDDIVKKFDEYCNPKKNTVFERSVYFKMTQKPDQPVDMFILSLKKQAALCEFAAQEQEKLLRDVLVIGIRGEKLREELLRDPDLDLSKAMQACKARERAHSEAAQMASFEPVPLAVNALKRRPETSPFSPNLVNLVDSAVY